MIEESPEKKTKLRSGYSTGACATATSLAAATLLLDQSQSEIKQIQITLPRGQKVDFDIISCQRELKSTEKNKSQIRCATIKDAGDDPDATHGAEVFSTVSLHDQPGLRFFAGEGVGTVTKAGLSLAIGEPAINPVPRQMMTEHLTALAATHNYSGGFDVYIGVVDGENIATKTMNGRLGILGGLSILGTTGIVKPFSCSAYIASIHQGVDVAKANGISHVAACTGSTSEAAVQKLYGLLPMEIIEVGDFVGALFKYLKRQSMPKLTLAAGFGKLCKLANGHTNLHSQHSQMNFQFLADIVLTHNPPPQIIKQIINANTSAEVVDICDLEKIPIADEICQLALKNIRALIPSKIEVEVLAVNKSANIIGRAGQLTN